MSWATLQLQEDTEEDDPLTNNIYRKTQQLLAP
jgi:hypothetical protein